MGTITGDTSIWDNLIAWGTEHTPEDDATEVATQSPIPAQAYENKGSAESIVEYYVDVTDQNLLDDFFQQEDNNSLLQTDLYRSSHYTNEDVSIRAYFQDLIDKDIFYKDITHISSILPERPMYGIIGGSIGGGTGGPTSLPVDFKYSPFVEPLLLDETFEIEAVLRAAFLPAFRPGEDAIIPHPDRHATMRVMSIDKEVIYATTNFFMEGYNKSTKESFKIIESTLGNTLQLNKEKYKLFKMRLGLVDAQEPFDWLRSWEDKWDRYMRASVLARNRWRWYILFGSHLIGGYPLQYSLGADAKDEPFNGIVVDIFVTDDVRLPEMKRMTTEDGSVYFRWGGTTYNPDNLQFERTIPEYPSIPAKASSPDEAEFENEP